MEWLDALVDDPARDTGEPLSLEDWAYLTFARFKEGDEDDEQADSIDDDAIRTEESPDAIASRCEELIKAPENAYAKAFRWGRLLGKLEADCCRARIQCIEQMAKALCNMDDQGRFLLGSRPSEEEFKLALAKIKPRPFGDDKHGPPGTVDDHQTDEISTNSSHASPGLSFADNLLNAVETLGTMWVAISMAEWSERGVVHLDDLLKALHEQSFGWLCETVLSGWREYFSERIGWPDWDANQDNFLHDLLDVEQFVADLGFTLGDMIGHSWTIDEERKAADWRALVPRRARLYPTSSVDHVRGILDDAEKVFAAGVSPSTFIASIDRAIELLTKRNWPSDFPAGQRTEVAGVLDKYRRTGSEAEQSFASTAKNLYHNYRNPSQHAAAVRRFNWLEAMYVFHGIRLLLSYSDRIFSKRS